MAERQELLSRVLVLASEAISLADRSHGAHSYTSGRSEAENKCCDARIQIDKLKEQYIRLSDEKAERESPKLTPKERIVLARIVGYYLRKRSREQVKLIEKGKVFVPPPGKRDVKVLMIDQLARLQQRLLAPPLVDSELLDDVEKAMGQDES